MRLCVFVRVLLFKLDRTIIYGPSPFNAKGDAVGVRAGGGVAQAWTGKSRPNDDE